MIATIVSVALYQGILLQRSIEGRPPPSESAYLTGLAAFSIPFLVLMAAEAIGLPRLLARLCAGVGFLALALVLFLAVTDQALFAAPAVLFTFGFFSAAVLLCTAVGLGTQNLVRGLRRRDGQI